MTDYEDKLKHKNDEYSLLERLTDFRQSVPIQSIEIGKHHWTYYENGNPEQVTLLLLSGGGGNAETMFPYIEGFSQHFRVIAPNLPPTIKKLDDAVNGLKALLDAQKIERVVIVGIAFGAMLAQLYIRRFQNTVIDIVITHSRIPSQHLAEPVQMQKKLMQFYPSPFLRWMNKGTYVSDITKSSTASSDATRKFWQNYFAELYSGRIRKKHLVARARLTAEYHSNNEFNSRDLLQWDGNLLIIESEEDNIISEGDRGSLKAMYSRAYVQTLAGYDHLAPILAADELVNSIINFLLKED